MLWQPIGNAPLDGTAVLVRCSERPEGHHLVSYIDGSWVDIHGNYILAESETGLPTHYAPLDPGPKPTRRRLGEIFAERHVCIMMLLVAAALSALLGATIENHFDVLPG